MSVGLKKNGDETAQQHYFFLKTHKIFTTAYSFDDTINNCHWLTHIFAAFKTAEKNRYFLKRGKEGLTVLSVVQKR